MSAASSPNDDQDRTGGINHIFKYVNAVRDAGQRLKARNRHRFLPAEMAGDRCDLRRDYHSQPIKRANLQLRGNANENIRMPLFRHTPYSVLTYVPRARLPLANSYPSSLIAAQTALRM
ncbi:aspartyl/asparaginyl beta-hydroxylase domain-containing protein [Serratia ureilytica]